MYPDTPHNNGLITSLNLRVEVGPCAACGAVYRTTGLTPDARGRRLCVFCHARKAGMRVALPPVPPRRHSRPRRHPRPPSATWPGAPYMTQDEFIARYPTMSYHDLAELCHVSPPTIPRWAKRLGIFTPRRRRPGCRGSDQEGRTA